MSERPFATALLMTWDLPGELRLRRLDELAR